MCTAISYHNGDTYFGRNLDLERGYGEQVVITPRRYEFPMRCSDAFVSYHAMVGMALVMNDFPLYFEATNECGLSAAGLNFPGNAYYHEYVAGMDNVASFELIPWVLGQCESVDDAKKIMRNLNVLNVDFSKELKQSPLHWMFSDKEKSIVVESLKDGLRIYDNPFQVLTNNPTFDYHLMNMSNYMGLSVGTAPMNFSSGLPMSNYSFGMGALGLPGDYSSASRFVRVCFVKENSVSSEDEMSAVNQFFHILDSVAMPRGCVWTENGYEYTRYNSCCNVNRGIYYYKTYENSTIASVNMNCVDWNQKKLKIFEIRY